MRCDRACFASAGARSDAVRRVLGTWAPAEAPECRIAHELAHRSIGFRQAKTRYRLCNRRHRQRSGQHRQWADPCRTRHSHARPHARHLSHSKQQWERTGAIDDKRNSRKVCAPDRSLAIAPMPASSRPIGIRLGELETGDLGTRMPFGGSRAGRAKRFPARSEAHFGETRGEPRKEASRSGATLADMRLDNQTIEEGFT